MFEVVSLHSFQLGSLQYTKMLPVTIAVFVLAVVSAAPPNIVRYPTDDVQVIKYENDNLGGGNYRFAFEQSDGTKHEQEGELKSGGGQEEDFLVMRGVYSWVGPDGVSYSISYVADENGFNPKIDQGAGGAIPDQVVALIG